jgi:hypothetical protein
LAADDVLIWSLLPKKSEVRLLLLGLLGRRAYNLAGFRTGRSSARLELEGPSDDFF